MYLFLLTLILFWLADSALSLYLASQKKSGRSRKAVLFAKFTPGAIVSEIRNKIAATVFSRNGSGAIIRNRIKPVNRRSTTQTEQRQLLSSLAASWRGLTAAQRESWIAAAPDFPQQDNLGQTITLSGEQFFIRCNANLVLIGQSQITSAPAPTSFEAIVIGAIVVSTAAKTIAYTPDPVPAGYELVIRASRPLSAGKSFVSPSALRYIQDEAAAAASPADIDAAYSALFGGTITAGMKVFVELFFVEIASGLAGQKVRASVITT